MDSIYFQFKASFAPCTIFQVIQYDLEKMQLQLNDTVKRAPELFQGVPVVIDLEKLSLIEPPDFAGLKKLLLDSGLVPVGVRHASVEQQKEAILQGLPILADGKATSLEKKSVKKAVSSGVSKLVTTPIRSGMQVYARDADLIVTAPVSAGAELLADGYIHVYGPLRGRAMAGVQGDKGARIFCHTLEAELVSIAGFYLTKEDIQALPKNHDMIQVYLENEQIKIESIYRNFSG